MTQSVLFATPDSDIAPVTEDAAVDCAPKRDDWRKGAIVERLFEIAALERGYEISVNIGGGKDFDYIVRFPGQRPVVVQIKTGWFWPLKNCYQIYNRASSGLYSINAYDVLAVFLADRNQWLFYSRAELGNRTLTTYMPRELRERARKSFTASHGESVADREPNNWSLLDEVAASLSRQ